MKLSQVAKILKAQLTGADGEFQNVSIDSRTLQRGDLFIALQGPSFDGHDFVNQAQEKGACAAIVSNPMDSALSLILVKDTQKALMDLACYHREQHLIPLVAITGSCGKTTTRALVASILEQEGLTLSSQGSFNNNIGVPLMLLKLNVQHEYMVQEIGANHAGEILPLVKIAKPRVAVLTCAAPVHLEGFGDLKGVATAKSEIFQGLDKDGVAIINADDEFCEFWKKQARAFRVITFGIHKSADVQAKNLQSNSDGAFSFRLETSLGAVSVLLKLIGAHNVINALAAASAAVALNISLQKIKVGLELAEPEKRRLNIKVGFRGAKIIDDSYNANPAAFLAAIHVLKPHQGKKVLVVGDMGELGDHAEFYHQELGRQAKAFGVDKLYCVGSWSKHCATTFGQEGFHFESKHQLIEALKKKLDAETTVLVKGSFSMGMDEVVKGLVKVA